MSLFNYLIGMTYLRCAETKEVVLEKKNLIRNFKFAILYKPEYGSLILNKIL